VASLAASLVGSEHQQSDCFCIGLGVLVWSILLESGNTRSGEIVCYSTRFDRGSICIICINTSCVFINDMTLAVLNN